MALHGKPLCPSMSSRIVLCIDSVRDRDVIGRAYAGFDAEKLEFHNILELFEQVDRKFDEYSFPQPTHEYRSFQPKKNQTYSGRKDHVIMQDDAILNERGENATFIIHVKFRQNASWQGNIQWVDGKKRQQFRSALELIKLVDEALSAGKDGELEWDEEDGSDPACK